jgi:hypothetical protein
MWLINYLSATFDFYSLKGYHRYKVLGSVPENKKSTVSYKMKFSIATCALDKILFGAQEETFRIVAHHIQIHLVNMLSIV